MPIVSAFLCDEDHTPVAMLPKRYAATPGPRDADFPRRAAFGLSDLLYYDDDVLLNEYPYLKIQNLIGNLNS